MRDLTPELGWESCILVDGPQRTECHVETARIELSRLDERLAQLPIP